MKIIQLGKAAAVPVAGEYNVCYLAECAGNRILIETPPSILNQLNCANIGVDTIDWVFISHLHGDHALGLPMLLLADYMKKTAKIWNIICQNYMVSKLKQASLIFFPEFEEYLEIRVKFHPVEDSESLKINKETSVFCKSGIHGAPSVGIRINCAGKSIAYSGDTAYSRNIADLSRGTDILIHEMGGLDDDMTEKQKNNHASAKETGITAFESVCGQLWFTHLKTIDSDYNRQCIDEAKFEFSGKTVKIQKDFEWIEA